MMAEDLKIQVDTTIRTSEKCFQVGELRISAVFFLLMLAPSGVRFGDIEVALTRNPLGGPHVLMIRYT